MAFSTGPVGRAGRLCSVAAGADGRAIVGGKEVTADGAGGGGRVCAGGAGVAAQPTTSRHSVTMLTGRMPGLIPRDDGPRRTEEDDDRERMSA